MRFPAFLAFSIFFSVAAASAAASGDAPSQTHKDTLVQADGTNVKGQSGNFSEYLKEGEEEKESDSLELMKISDDAKVDIDGQDGAAVRFGY